MWTTVDADASGFRFSAFHYGGQVGLQFPLDLSSVVRLWQDEGGSRRCFECEKNRPTEDGRLLTVDHALKGRAVVRLIIARDSRCVSDRKPSLIS
jgi:hypothetical protein